MMEDEEGELTPHECWKLMRRIRSESNIRTLTDILNTTRRRMKQLAYQLETGLIDNPNHPCDDGCQME